MFGKFGLAADQRWGTVLQRVKNGSNDPLGAIEGETPIVRGGSALNTPGHCRSAYRSYVYSKNAYPFLGLRLALVPVRNHSSTEKETPDHESAVAP